MLTPFTKDLRAPLKTLSDARIRVLALPNVQQRIFLMMCSYWSANDQLPVTATIAKRMGYRSLNSAHEVVMALEGKGLLERNENQKLRFSRVEGINLGEVFRDGIAGKSVVNH